MNFAKRLKLNVVFALIYQVVVIIGSFIIPRLILQQYGSLTNGLINSVTQFLFIISFLDMGVGTVVASALFEPISKNNTDKVSVIVTASDRFYRKIAIILAIYVYGLMIIYPRVVKSQFSDRYISALIFAIGISLFAQYFFGITDLYLLTATQESYVQYFVQIITYIFSLGVSCFLIFNKASIILVKLVASGILILRPILIRLYVNKKYKLDRKCRYDEEPIKQKWYGVAQHISFVVLQNTDSLILTVFMDLKMVSVYSVYNMVVMGIKSLIASATSALMPAFGDLLARRNYDKAREIFDYSEWIIHNIVVIVYGCTSVLILSFVHVYTKGITDISYDYPTFAVLISVANAAHCIRIPYNNMVKAAGKYKETQWAYYFSALSNIVISVVCVKIYGLVGVAFGTVVAMVIQTVWLAIYEFKNILRREFSVFVKQILVDISISILAFIISDRVIRLANNYFEWIIMAIYALAIWCIVDVCFNYLFYRNYCRKMVKMRRKVA